MSTQSGLLSSHRWSYKAYLCCWEIKETKALLGPVDHGTKPTSGQALRWRTSKMIRECANPSSSFQQLIMIIFCLFLPS
jgi:hypothetical protein